MIKIVYNGVGLRPKGCDIMDPDQEGNSLNNITNGGLYGRENNRVN